MRVLLKFVNALRVFRFGLGVKSWVVEVSTEGISPVRALLKIVSRKDITDKGGGGWEGVLNVFKGN